MLNVALLLSCMAGAANAGEAVDKTLAVKADGLVRIDNVRGHIEVQGWDRSDVTVKGTLDDLADVVQVRNVRLDDHRKGRNAGQSESRQRLGPGD